MTVWKFEDRTSTPSGPKPEIKAKTKNAQIWLKLGMCIAKTLIMKSWKFEDPTNTPSGEKPEVKEN